MSAFPLHGRVVVQNVSIPRGLSFPHQVVNHPDLSLEERRAILSAWASDASAVPDMPTLRQLPATPFPVTFASIQEARDRVDQAAETGWYAGDRGRGFGSSSDPRH